MSVRSGGAERAKNCKGKLVIDAAACAILTLLIIRRAARLIIVLEHHCNLATRMRVARCVGAPF